MIGLVFGQACQMAQIPDGGVAAQVVGFELIVGFESHGQESPAVAPGISTLVVVGRDEGRHDRTADGQRTAPTALVAAVLVVDFPDALAGPLAALLPDVGVVGIEGIVRRRDNLLHILQGLRIALLVVLIHHHLGIHHVAHGLRGATGIGAGPAHGQHVGGDDLLEFANELGIHVVGLVLRGGVGSVEVFEIERNVAEVVPQHIIIEHAHGTGLHLVALLVGFADALVGPSQVAQQVVAALDARIVDRPERAERIVLVALIVEELVPVGHVVLGLAAYPEVVALDFGVDVECIVLSQSPVGPVDRVVGGNECLLQVLVALVVIFEEVAVRVGYLQKVVAAAGSEHGRCCKQTDGYISCFHIDAIFFSCKSIVNYPLSIVNYQLERQVHADGIGACLRIDTLVNAERGAT